MVMCADTDIELKERILKAKAKGVKLEKRLQARLRKLGEGYSRGTYIPSFD